MQKPQLFLLHYAGGSCYSYKEITPSLVDFEVISLELPGRGSRIEERLLKNYELAAIDFYKQITRKLDRQNFAIYGHSMGAILAMRVVEMLENDGKKPVVLFVSGNSGPRTNVKSTKYQMSSDDFIKELRILGGVSEAFLENKELFDFFEPILRADFEIAENHEVTDLMRLNTPIHAMMGSLEEKIDCITTWKQFTNGQFTYEIIQGDHFFIFKHPVRIAEIIKHNFQRHS